ncbi:hypothetical protein IPA_03400 [Ignicoccus pacificus DSM 13166]|uniref:Uncharacterized protein n=1 Tax=Ignicoccus pacificus DSM 13166 TaxID=940294 RepID=A0A977KCP4_9CREN|nr:hypothetical protein IPA_03400 [Ignicoccus pacificus DSM 13166]
MLLKPSDSLKEAEKLGIPVPLWSFEPNIEPPAYVKADVAYPHKSDVGGVRRAETKEELLKYYQEIKERFGSAIVQKEVKGNLELLVSMKRDRVFGRVLVVALGGLLASLLKESVVTSCPFCEEVFEKKIEGSRLGELLKGYRRIRVDKECLFSVLEKLCSAEAETFEINPLLLAEGGCWAVDVKVWK